MDEGRVVGLYIAAAAKAQLLAVEEVRAEAGRGLEGDRYWARQGTFWKPLADREVTLIETEALEDLAARAGITLEPRDARRNIATRGVRLNGLVLRRFSVGEALLLGIRLCEPCEHLETLTGRPLREHLAGSGGLRAAILSGGVIRVGDAVTVQAQEQLALTAA